ncbi:TIGR04283 family arsenosugar biosynthesis glycosyltransferase [Adhaeribacter sp. BT258]|uniref:TIGR04283 family arsenosugar biosynthesis glycosyltransferase n=1 Tax=Adhaeribacter terrigena TaxID=2793070 RepID=A0ABS1BZ83_9BACT|nr:TIGR04283 family arsenosugar biosynthesis glycosyltransferase [Adhaeribacter terrigena]MBK0402478.1 TIGR04283 family arsenosugar biosynthesis glycosyltransferase [Adhaeribacter terrigena]
MKISVIIPAYNEAAGIGALIEFLQQHLSEIPYEILVADGQSTDATRNVAEMAGATVLHCPEKGRARQMNYGAKKATGTLLYFLHADTFPPANFPAAISDATDKGVDCGCFRLGFDLDHWFLNLNSWFTRFNVRYFRWGDQSLFIKREVFEAEGGFRDDLKVMEDQELVIRLLKKYRFKVLPFAVKTSARKYQENGVIKLQLIFTTLQIMYHFGASQEQILGLYRRLIRDEKVNVK